MATSTLRYMSSSSQTKSGSPSRSCALVIAKPTGNFTPPTGTTSVPMGPLVLRPTTRSVTVARAPLASLRSGVGDWRTPLKINSELSAADAMSPMPKATAPTADLSTA